MNKEKWYVYDAIHKYKKQTSNIGRFMDILGFLELEKKGLVLLNDKGDKRIHWLKKENKE